MKATHASQCEISSAELARWIEAQGQDCWWTVDNDPLLTGLEDFPCPGDVLAEVLRRISRPLLVLTSPNGAQPGDVAITAERLDAYVGRLGDSVYVQQGEKPLWANDRVLFLRWKDAGDEWMLVEDSATSKSSANDRSSS